MAGKGIADCQFPIGDWRLENKASVPEIGNWQSAFGN
jgi:hypothetical protein